MVAIDGETQVTALHELYDDPEQYGTTYQKLNAVRLPFELYWGLSVEDARQIFYDRNVEGVSVDKNLAMSMDQRDLGTQLAHRIAEAVKVEHDGRIIPFARLVQARKRQLTRTDPELITLSALRVLVIATIFGRRGLGLASTTVRSSDLPETASAEQIECRVVQLLSTLLTQLYRDGIAASANARGVLNFGGGAKDSGGRAADAILYPDTESGRKIRGR